ncbi:MAG TPA: sigma 54-interacting transcriptional regulator [Polyangiaceae bacterium]|nr:sigma 54-interacting transcriptional regulator [Polyangiaceae bacterium]
MNDASYTHRPGPGPHQGALDALVYVRQTCTTHPLPAQGTLRLGRGTDNDIRIDDQSVSRYHLLIHVGAGIEVEDLGSANGTLLFRVDPEDTLEAPTRPNEAEARLRSGERRLLEPGDFVRVGSALIMVQARRPTSTRHPRALSIPPAGEGPAVLLDPEMKRAYEIALRAAQSGISVLITGETGSGKEVFAETIHQRSARRARPFLRLNCAALSESLLESQLFGHERGAFTGANQTKPGLLESTDQGTVFLDEIGEMPLSIQAKLLRVLEERTILRVGATKPRPIDVRFVWATNRDLRLEVQAGRFRNDLYYRIAGVEFSIPPLRRRPLEIEPLARLFLRRFCERSGLPTPELTKEALRALHAYSWPGNVRELKNIMERAPFMCENGAVTAAQIPQQPLDELDADEFPAEEQERTQVFAPLRTPHFDDDRAPAEPPSSAPRRSNPSLPAIDSEEERQRVLRALEQCGGNQTRAAKVLGVSRRTLINRVERLNLPRPKKT